MLYLVALFTFAERFSFLPKTEKADFAFPKAESAFAEILLSAFHFCPKRLGANFAFPKPDFAFAQILLSAFIFAQNFWEANFAFLVAEWKSASAFSDVEKADLTSS